MYICEGTSGLGLRTYVTDISLIIEQFFWNRNLKTHHQREISNAKTFFFPL